MHCDSSDIEFVLLLSSLVDIFTSFRCGIKYLHAINCFVFSRNSSEMKEITFVQVLSCVLTESTFKFLKI